MVEWYSRFIKLDSPFTYVRFNDGEMMGIRKPGVNVARGDQIITPSLREWLIEAISFKADNYFVGVPCSLHYPDLRKLANKYTDSDILATELTNRNYKKVKKYLPARCLEFDVLWVGGEDQKKLGWVDKILNYPRVNSWAYYPEILQDVKKNVRDVNFFSLGPTANILCYDLYKLFPDKFFINIGSVFDPQTRGVYHRCHRGILPPCKECN